MMKSASRESEDIVGNDPAIGALPVALKVSGLHTYYGDSHVLHGVDLDLPRRSIGCVVGRNGVGKTTLVRSILGLSPPAQGQVHIGAEDVSRWPAHRLARCAVALVPQGRRIFPSLTVLEHLQIGARTGERGVDGLAAAPWTIDRALEIFPRLQERLGHRAATLSGGERQMLAVARALVANPRLLIMDEPTEGLSPAIVDQLRELLLRLRSEGVSILLVEQNLAVVLALADCVHIMDKGRIVHACSAVQLGESPEMTRRYLGV